MRKFMNGLTAYLLALHIKKVKTATFYAGPDATVKITEIGKWRARDRRLDFRVTLGKPNYADRKFIKVAKKAGEKFPVKKVQLKLRKGV